MNWQLGIAALFIAVFLALMARAYYPRYWIRADGVQGTAQISAEGSHNGAYYTYVVAHQTYSGYSYRDWRSPEYGAVAVGEKAPVWYSASHPWLSLLYMPDNVFEGLFGIMLVVGFALVIVIAIVRPAWLRRRQRAGSAG